MGATVRLGESTHSRPRCVQTALLQPHGLFPWSAHQQTALYQRGRYFPLFKTERARPVRLARDEFGGLFTTTSRAESRSWPRQGQGWTETETAAIQQLRTKSGAVAAKAAVRGQRGEKAERRGREGSAAKAPIRSRRWSGRREANPRSPAGSPALCRAAARCNADPPAGVFKEATDPVPTRLQSGDPAEQFRGSLTFGRLCPGANGERDERRTYVCSPTSRMGKGRVKESGSCPKPPPFYTHFSVGSGNMFQGRWRFLGPLLRQAALV